MKQTLYIAHERSRPIFSLVWWLLTFLKTKSLSSICRLRKTFWAIWVNTALNGRELSGAIIETSVKTKTNERSLLLMVRTAGDNTLKTVQECELARDVWEKLPKRYARKTVTKKLTLLNILLKRRYKRRENIGIISQFSYHNAPDLQQCDRNWTIL